MVAKAEKICESQFRRRFLRTGLRNFGANRYAQSAALPRHARCEMRDTECWRIAAQPIVEALILMITDLRAVGKLADEIELW